MTCATDHVQRQCPQKEEMEHVVVVARNAGDRNDVGGDEDPYHEKVREEERQRLLAAKQSSQAVRKKPKVVNFK
jgi:hypothetical protein